MRIHSPSAAIESYESIFIELSHSYLSRAILSMDSNEQLPIDMVEQLLKFTPSAEERALLDEHSEDIDSLARADRFLYEISK